MANTYSWDCRTVDTYPAVNEFSNVVYNVHWRLTATDDSGKHSATIIGTHLINTEDISSETFVSIENITHEDVIRWVEESMGVDAVNDIKASLDNEINEKISPKSITVTIGNF